MIMIDYNDYADCVTNKCTFFYDIKTEQKHWRLVILDVQNQI